MQSIQIEETKTKALKKLIYVGNAISDAAAKIKLRSKITDFFKA